jgi:hypothetical protein
MEGVASQQDLGHRMGLGPAEMGGRSFPDDGTVSAKGKRREGQDPGD